MKINSLQHARTVVFALATLVVVGCSSDVENPDPNIAGTPPVVAATPVNPVNPDPIEASTGTYSLRVATSVTVTEGEPVTLNVEVLRSAGFNNQVILAIENQSGNDDGKLSWSFSNTRLQANQNSSTVTFNMDYSNLPIQRQTRTIRVVGTDGSSSNVAIIDVNIEPTSRPDVYLLVGQSNMVGFSEDNAKQVFSGGLDEPNQRIQQLNVTGNDGENFDSIAAFTDPGSIAVPSPRTSIAVDALHDGFDSSINGKLNTRVGLGLSFAKQAIQNTQADIYLVPAAWSDTGFCQRTRAEFQGVLGWNATPNPDPNFSGTLLHDRAIARTNLALNETGGILRGILWHQGEADSGNMVCAQQYENNMVRMVSSFRTNIQQDARGPSARRADSNIPFIVGTMSRGPGYEDFDAAKTLVDGVHKNISGIVPHAAVVNNDSLLPPAHPCGEGDCIHFGSTALRLMGSVYYSQLLEVGSR